MRRHFSSILILLILLVSPVSYASEEISDFDTNCPVSELYQVKLSQVRPADAPSSSPVRQVLHRDAAQFVRQLASYPPVAWINPFLSERAPPL